MLDHVVGAPQRAALIAADGRRVIAPTDVLRVEFVAEGRVIETRRNARPERALRRDGRDDRTRRRVAAPRLRIGIVGGQTRLRRNQKLVRGITRIDLRREHVVGQRELLGQRDVRRSLRSRNVRILRVLRRRRAADVTDEVEPVHLPARVRGHVIDQRVVRVVRLFERHRLQRDRRIGIDQPARSRVRAGKTVEEVVETPVLLHDEHDVLDHAARAHRRLRRRRRRARTRPGTRAGRRAAAPATARKREEQRVNLKAA